MSRIEAPRAQRSCANLPVCTCLGVLFCSQSSYSYGKQNHSSIDGVVYLRLYLGVLFVESFSRQPPYSIDVTGSNFGCPHLLGRFYIKPLRHVVGSFPLSMITVFLRQCSQSPEPTDWVKVATRTKPPEHVKLSQTTLFKASIVGYLVSNRVLQLGFRKEGVYVYMQKSIWDEQYTHIYQTGTDVLNQVKERVQT